MKNTNLLETILNGYTKAVQLSFASYLRANGLTPTDSNCTALKNATKSDFELLKIELLTVSDSIKPAELSALIIQRGKDTVNKLFGSK